MRGPKYAVPSNSTEAFRACIGETVKGVLLGDWHSNPNAVRTLVFESGWGLSFGGNGSYWTVAPERVQQGISVHRRRLEDRKADLEGVLALAGEATEATP